MDKASVARAVEVGVHSRCWRSRVRPPDRWRCSSIFSRWSPPFSLAPSWVRSSAARRRGRCWRRGSAAVRWPGAVRRWGSLARRLHAPWPCAQPASRPGCLVPRLARRPRLGRSLADMGSTPGCRRRVCRHCQDLLGVGRRHGPWCLAVEGARCPRPTARRFLRGAGRSRRPAPTEWRWARWKWTGSPIPR